VPSFDGLPPLPELNDPDSIERKLIPALEAWVAESHRDDAEWGVRLTLLTAVHNRLWMLRTTDDLMDQIEFHFKTLTAAITAATDDGVARVIAGRVADE
jgi:hypothetical protein